MQRRPQPPVRPAERDREQHDFWPAFIVVVIAGILLFVGATRLTALATVDGETAREIQLIKAFSSGGLKYETGDKPPPQPIPGDPGATAAALDRWAREQEARRHQLAKVLVDTGASTPCPT